MGAGLRVSSWGRVQGPRAMLQTRNEQRLPARLYRSGSGVTKTARVHELVSERFPRASAFRGCAGRAQ